MSTRKIDLPSVSATSANGAPARGSRLRQLDRTEPIENLTVRVPTRVAVALRKRCADTRDSLSSAVTIALEVYCGTERKP
jgi:hypothetical protein